MIRRDLTRILCALALGGGFAVAAQQLPLLGAPGHAQDCAEGHESQAHGSVRHLSVRHHSDDSQDGDSQGEDSDVGDHSKPTSCPPHGCAIGRGGPVGDRSKPCPTPPGCAIGNDRFVGDHSKPCPTPHGHHNKGHHEGPDASPRSHNAPAWGAMLHHGAPSAVDKPSTAPRVAHNSANTAAGLRHVAASSVTSDSQTVAVTRVTKSVAASHATTLRHGKSSVSHRHHH